MTAKEKILKIMALALEIDPPELENIGKKRTAVFVWWSPHCNLIELNIYLNGWSSYTDPDVHFYGYSTDSEYLDSVIIRLKEIKGNLKGRVSA